MRGKDGYDNVIKVIDALRSIVPISVMYCASQWNTMEDLKHVAEICKVNNLDLRVGVYSEILFFDTQQPAYRESADIHPPEILKEFSENYDYLLLYNEFRKGGLKLSCNSILDTAIVFPDGSVPLCLHLDSTLGNIFNESLDEIFRKAATKKTIREHRTGCNSCYINFHRKFDLILYRQFEKYFPRWAVSKMLGWYQWNEGGGLKYDAVIRKLDKRS
jgi:MoaA/NifB/PqqE/SkfB family radical SAM enzyme